MPTKYYRIGRSAEDSDIVIEDPQRTVSSLHAELYQDELGRWYLIDRSRNGTFIYRNSSWTKLKHDAIAPGESLSFGKQIVTVDWILSQIQQLRSKTAQPPPKVKLNQNIANKGYIRDPETGKIRPRKNDEK